MKTAQYIFEWLNKKSYQTGDLQQEYKGYYDVDMPKILNEFLAEHSSQPTEQQGSDIEDLRQAAYDNGWRDSKNHFTSELESLRKENENLRSVMVAAAEEIKAHWQAHCDKEGYGPSNLLHRLEKGIPAQYRYTAGAFAELEAQLKVIRHLTYTPRIELLDRINGIEKALESSPKEQPEQKVDSGQWQDIMTTAAGIDPDTGKPFEEQPEAQQQEQAIKLLQAHAEGEQAAVRRLKNTIEELRDKITEQAQEIERLRKLAIERFDHGKELQNNLANERREIERLKASKWISVKDRLPEVEGRYLTMRHSGSIIVEHWFKKDSKFLWGDCYGVKFWMPIPEPPKQ